ncbi:GNAT family N-acetyltransferase [Gordonia sp. SID5947]|uniref:GNAT family N-acetyltransferase n=1 Tax=Gordonia sp. SID5947 TaxID=2690315 RepID=UPI001369CF7D|nr:GNAT family N-acetyltransferase [Gordonia sp. SID5947]MYR06673.1 GNAT family N-acetyltransferase [Gordonia sp. SID5947]
MPHTSSTAVEIRELSSPTDLQQLTHVFDDVWHPDPGNRPVSVDMLRALSHAGNYVAGAYVGDRLAGGSVGFFSAPVGRSLHSHITGVSRIGRGHNVGHALKMHQREWALARGLQTITWTFDPLVARNAYFNLTKVGAVPVAYHRDFYGEPAHEMAGGDESDRLLVSWSLESSAPEASTDTVDALLRDGARLAIEADGADPRPVTDLGAGSVVIVPVPRDIESMRRTHPVTAARWRSALRMALAPFFGPADADLGQTEAQADAPTTRFLRSGHYVVNPVHG